MLTGKYGVQRYITRTMRAVLVDWLVDVHSRFKVRVAKHCPHFALCEAT
jgi:Cyclin, N-terminal domain